MLLTTDTPLRCDTISHAPDAIHPSALSEETKEYKAKKQSALADEMKFDIGRVLYEGEWVRNHFCSAPTWADGLLDELVRSGHFRLTGNKVNISGWPSSNEPEPYFYEPFSKLLNVIVDTIEGLECSSCPLFEGVRFSKHDKEMAETVPGEHPVKPDIIGYKDLEAIKRASWYRTVFVCVVKGTWTRLVTHAATYARCLFAACEHRVFVPMFLFNHISAEFRLGMYHRSGVLATSAMNILTRQGLSDLVSTLAGIWSWSSLKSAGFDPAQTHSHIKLNAQPFHIDRVVCRRQGIHGRVTSVFVVNRDDLASGESPSLSTSDPEPKPAEPGTQARAPGKAKAPGRQPTWRRLNPFEHWDALVPSESHTIELEEELPDNFVVKCAHTPYDREDEVEVFASVQGYLGIPRILGAYSAYGFPLSEGQDILPWSLFDDIKPRPYLRRHHRHLLIQTIGRHLESATSPRELGEGLLHGLIGHCALLTEGGYLHRDVSNGNILLLDKPEERKIPPFLSTLVKNGTCRGVLIDGDVAKKWDATSKSKHRSGTKPFISRRVTRMWSNSAEYIHTPIDDLESFLWVLLYTLLALADLEDDYHAGWWESFNSNNLRVLQQNKDSLFLNCLRPSDMPSTFSAFEPLLTAWAEAADHYASALKKLLEAGGSLEDVKNLSLEAYCVYIEAAQKHLPTQETW